MLKPEDWFKFKNSALITITDGDEGGNCLGINPKWS